MRPRLLQINTLIDTGRRARIPERLIVTQQQCEYFKEAHPIAKALAEGNCDLLDPHIQAMVASGQ